MVIIQEIIGYFIIGIIGMLAMMVLYLPFYFILRKRVPLARQAAVFLFIVCVFVILDATIIGTVLIDLKEGIDIISDVHFLNLIPFYSFSEDWLMGERKKYTQIIANIIMFIPIGFITPVTFKKARKLWKTAVYMAVFSFLIEFIQYFIGRSADIDDLLLNTSGGMAGYGIYYVFSKLFKKKKDSV